MSYNNISISQATYIQNLMRQDLSLEKGFTKITMIAGGDVSHNKNEDTVYAGIVILSYPQLILQSYSLVVAETKFPYAPGFLGFREVPALLQAWEQIPSKPDMMILDGQGITHPRRMGIASHFGLLANTPAIGCAKSMLFGKFPSLGLGRFSNGPINNNQNELLGFALRTKNGVEPVYISPGHKISAPDSLSLMIRCLQKHRIPEPTRLAHEKVNLLRTGQIKTGISCSRYPNGIV